jgi:uncharacterized protein (DUF433 family)
VSVQVEPEELPPQYLERFMVDPAIAIGKLLVKGTGLPVDHLTHLVEEGLRDEEMLRRHPELTAADVDAVRQYAKVPEGLRRSFGGWAEDAEELDKYLKWCRQHRSAGYADERRFTKASPESAISSDNQLAQKPESSI